MKKTNYHSHTLLCDHAEGMPIDYVKRAVELGYYHLGISCHGPLLPEWDDRRMNIDEFYNIYLPSINEAQEAYKNKIKVFKGLEIEYLGAYKTHYKKLLEDLDYLILGQHVIKKDNKIISVYSGMTDENLVIYKDHIVEALKTGYFKILAHPDLFMFRYQEWNKHVESVCKEIIEAAIKYDVVLEVNANGIRRKPIINQDGNEVYIYPRIEFWELVSTYKDAKVIIGEDNHYINYTGDKAVDKAFEFARKLGLNITQVLFEDIK